MIHRFAKSGTSAFFLSAILSLILVQPAAAEEISFETIVDRTTVAIDGSITLSLKVHGTNALSNVQLPPIEGFESRYYGPLFQDYSFNDVTMESVTFRYVLYPQETGEFQIPSLSVTIAGETYTSEPIDVEVVEKLVASAPSQNQADNDLEDRLFLVIETAKRDVYVNEKVPLTMALYVHNVGVENVEFPEFDHTGFTADAMKHREVYEKTVGGIPYRVKEFYVDVYPTRSGELTLGPAAMKCNIRVRQSRRGSLFGKQGPPLGEDFFDSLFITYRTEERFLQSADLVLNVQPLPAVGKPEDFSGAVGRFDFDVTVNPDDLQVGDPITLRMRVSGDGNIAAVTLPKVEKLTGNPKNFKFYDPQISTEEGEKTVEQVAIPKNDQIKEFPAMTFAYFDPGKKLYQSITKGPFPLKVKKSSLSDPLAVVGGQALSVNLAPEQLGRDIIFLKDQPGPFQPRRFKRYQSWPFVALMFLAVLAWSTGLVLYRVKLKLTTDVKFAKRLKAPGAARKGLLQAQEALGRGEVRTFYDILFRTLQNYFSNRFHLAPGSVTLTTLEQTIRPKDKNGVLFDKIKTVFEACEMVRFASGDMDKEKMQTSLQCTREIIDYMERHAT